MSCLSPVGFSSLLCDVEFAAGRLGNVLLLLLAMSWSWSSAMVGYDKSNIVVWYIRMVLRTQVLFQRLRTYPGLWKRKNCKYAKALFRKSEGNDALARPSVQLLEIRFAPETHLL